MCNRECLIFWTRGGRKNEIYDCIWRRFKSNPGGEKYRTHKCFSYSRNNLYNTIFSCPWKKDIWIAVFLPYKLQHLLKSTIHTKPAPFPPLVVVGILQRWGQKRSHNFFALEHRHKVVEVMVGKGVISNNTAPVCMSLQSHGVNPTNFLWNLSLKKAANRK